MSNQSLGLSEDLHNYLLTTVVSEHPVLAELRAETLRMPMARMQIAPEQGQFMQLLIRMLGARRTIEVGVFTGYSALATALALPADGQLIACDIDADYTAIARRYWEQAGVSERIDLRLAPARDTLDELIAAGDAGQYDFAFIDADKEGYGDYYEQCLTLLRPGGLVALDNALWDGRVADATVDDQETRAIRTVNRKVAQDTRVDCSLVPIGDGLLLARKR